MQPNDVYGITDHIKTTPNDVYGISDHITTTPNVVYGTVQERQEIEERFRDTAILVYSRQISTRRLCVYRSKLILCI